MVKSAVKLQPIYADPIWFLVQKNNKGGSQTVLLAQPGDSLGMLSSCPSKHMGSEAGYSSPARCLPKHRCLAHGPRGLPPKRGLSAWHAHKSLHLPFGWGLSDPPPPCTWPSILGTAGTACSTLQGWGVQTPRSSTIGMLLPFAI